MCLLTRQIKPIITKKDMIVIKRLRIEESYNNSELFYYSYYYLRFQYVPEVLNKTELGIDRRLPKDTSAYGNTDTVYYKEGPLTNRKLTVITQGFHFIIKDSPSYGDLYIHEKRNCIFKFLIPKGSTIFLGKTGLGVSNQIIMLKP